LTHTHKVGLTTKNKLSFFENTFSVFNSAIVLSAAVVHKILCKLWQRTYFYAGRAWSLVSSRKM